MLTLPDEVKFHIAIAFPDEGAHKRFHGMFQEFPQITCIKVRNGDQRLVTIKEGEPKDYHVVIIDDLVQTGGTLKNCGRVSYFCCCRKYVVIITRCSMPKSGTSFRNGEFINRLIPKCQSKGHDLNWPFSIFPMLT